MSNVPIDVKDWKKKLVCIRKKFSSELYESCNKKTIIRLFVIVSLYFSLSYINILVNHILLSFLIWSVQGVIMVGFFNATHDCIHNTHFSINTLNNVLGRIYSIISLVDYSYYKSYHLKHHRFTSVSGDSEEYLEPKGLIDYLKSMFFYNFYLFYFSIWKKSFVNVIFFYRQEKIHILTILDSFFLVFWFIFLMTWLYIDSKLALYLYIIPALFYFFVASIIGYPEHSGMKKTNNTFENTRSITSNSIFRYLFWNGNYHLEHHLLPSVPYCNLPAFSKILDQHGLVQNRETSYLKFHWFEIVRLSKVHK